MAKAEHDYTSRFAGTDRGQHNKVEDRPRQLPCDCFLELAELKEPVAPLTRCLHLGLLRAVGKKPVTFSAGPPVAVAIDEAVIGN